MLFCRFGSARKNLNDLVYGIHLVFFFFFSNRYGYESFFCNSFNNCYLKKIKKNTFFTMVWKCWIFHFAKCRCKLNDEFRLPLTTIENGIFVLTKWNSQSCNHMISINFPNWQFAPALNMFWFVILQENSDIHRMNTDSANDSCWKRMFDCN